jgi:hypothetical protein
MATPFRLSRLQWGINVPFAPARGDVLSSASTVMLLDSAGGSSRLAPPAFVDPSLEDAISG